MPTKNQKNPQFIPEGTVKASFNIDPAIVRKLRIIAALDGSTQTEILNSLLNDYIAKWEKKNGPIPVK